MGKEQCADEGEDCKDCNATTDKQECGCFTGTDSTTKQKGLATANQDARAGKSGYTSTAQ